MIFVVKAMEFEVRATASLCQSAVLMTFSEELMLGYATPDLRSLDVRGAQQ